MNRLWIGVLIGLVAVKVIASWQAALYVNRWLRDVQAEVDD